MSHRDHYIRPRDSDAELQRRPRQPSRVDGVTGFVTEIPFARDMRELVFGPRGATLRRVAQDSGANVRVDRDRCVIAVEGAPAAVEHVKDFYIKLLADSAASAVTLHVAESLVGRVIGKAGSTVKQIEATTGCSVSVSKLGGIITLRGSPDAMQVASRMIDKLTRGDVPHAHQRDCDSGSGATVLPFAPVLFQYLTRRAGGASLLEQVKSEFPGLCAIDVARAVGQLTISGDEGSVAAASVKLQAIILDAARYMGTFGTSPSGARAVIGQGGSTVKDLERQLGVDISVSKNNSITIYGRGDEGALHRALATVEKVAAGGH